MAIGVGDLFADFLGVMTVTGELRACDESLVFWEPWSQKHKKATFGEAIDTLADGTATNGDMYEAAMWARWCLWAHYDDIAADARERFVAIMAAEPRAAMTCYNMILRHKADLSDSSLAALRANVKGRLPNVKGRLPNVKGRLPNVVDADTI